MGRTRITTLEGLIEEGQLHPVQRAFIEEQAAQCGYCLNGMIITTAALLWKTPHPVDVQIREALDGNLCRCGSQLRILRAVKRAEALLSKAEDEWRIQKKDLKFSERWTKRETGIRSTRGGLGRGIRLAR